MITLLVRAARVLSGPDKVLIEDIFLRDDLLLQTFIILIVLVFFLLIVLIVSLSLIISVLMIDSIIEVLVIELLVLSIKFSHSCIESNGHVLVHKEAFYLFVNGLGLSSCLCVERTEDDRSRGVVLHQGIVIRVDRVLSKLCVQIIRLTFTLQFLKFRFLGDISEFLLNQIKLLLIENVDCAQSIGIFEPLVIKGLQRSQTFVWVLLEHFLHKVACLLTDRILKLDG